MFLYLTEKKQVKTSKDFITFTANSVNLLTALTELTIQRAYKGIIIKNGIKVVK